MSRFRDGGLLKYRHGRDRSQFVSEETWFFNRYPSPSPIVFT
ncbi:MULTISPECIES: hypothetical protein [unclassified Microcoleus]